MSKHDFVCKMKNYIQPFERRLALSELELVAGAVPSPNPPDSSIEYKVTTSRSLDILTKALTYWETVESIASNDRYYTRQVRREATVGIVRNGITPTQLGEILPFDNQAIPLPNRRVLRYGPHGAHEYRGKFFPQLVRALLTIAGIKRDDLVLDPMCGSGTTPVEALLLGCRVFGVDMNPLSVFMSRTKCGILAVKPNVLAQEYETLKVDLLKPSKRNSSSTWFDHLPEQDRNYLPSWFSPQVLADIDPIAIRINATKNATCRDLFFICLSNILRRVSWQKNDDLRVRKEIRPDIDIDALAEFITELGRTVRTILAFLYEDHPFDIGSVKIVEGDARKIVQPSAPLFKLRGKFKVVITSPPYATALPYLDTDRLSLSYLGLLSRPEHRIRDYAMVGNREVTEGRRRDYWSDYQKSRNDLPQSVTRLVDRINRLNETSEVGFRRRNLSALLAHYFLDMRQIFRNITVCLRPEGVAYVVIGNNHTIAGGQRVEIKTDELLSEIAESTGLVLERKIPMEMLLSRDIFKNNAVASETILCFRKPV